MPRNMSKSFQVTSIDDASKKIEKLRIYITVGTIKNYYWPPFKVTSIHLKEAIDPVPSWQNYQIKVVGDNKIYDSGYTIIPNNHASSMLGTFCEEPLQTPSTNHSAFLSSAVNSTFYKENSYNDLQPLTLFNISNTIIYVMEASDYMNSLLPTTSKCSYIPMTCEFSNSISQNFKFMVSQNQPFPNTIEKLSYPTIQNSSEVLLTVHKRIKDIEIYLNVNFRGALKKNYNYYIIITQLYPYILISNLHHKYKVLNYRSHFQKGLPMKKFIQSVSIMYYYEYFN
eukprot:XP_008179838.2 PREDICTED: uncharacterized protein LOC100573795 isoform X2 [Acyrthosiphon pisum]